MFETQKSENKTSSGEIGLNIKTLAGPKVKGDQVSGGESVLCWHAAPIANILWKSLEIRLKVKFSNKVQISNRVKNWCNSWSMEGVTVDDHHPECHVTFGRWDELNFIPSFCLSLFEYKRECIHYLALNVYSKNNPIHYSTVG